VSQEATTKRSILKTAEKLFADRGFANTKISDISSQVGIRDSTIYEHFRNKEDILFTIPEEKVIELINKTEEHIKGIFDAKTKLGKLTWLYLEHLSNNKDLAKLLLFEIRSYREFYKWNCYSIFKKFNENFRQIISEGQQNNEFGSDISPSVILKLFYGTIDNIVIAWLIHNVPADPMEFFNDFFDLLIHAIQKENGRKNLNKKERIMDAAYKIFAQYGYKKARIQDIIQAAGVGDGTIYQYFENKQEILFSLAINKANECFAVQKKCLDRRLDIEDKIDTYIREYLYFISSEKEAAASFILDTRYNRYYYQTESYKIFRETGRILHDLIVEGIEQHRYRQNVNPYLATLMIFGIIDQTILSWIILDKPISFTQTHISISKLIRKALKQDTE
jgi:TetR/AcrR family transcriptional regulator, fatty acid metabolism regulator protein